MTTRKLLSNDQLFIHGITGSLQFVTPKPLQIVTKSNHLRLVVGFIETAGGVLILIPWTATYAGVAVTAVMAGAFYTRIGAGFPEDLAWIAAYAVALLWIAFEWRSFRWPRFGRRAVDQGSGEENAAS